MSISSGEETVAFIGNHDKNSPSLLSFSEFFIFITLVKIKTVRQSQDMRKTAYRGRHIKAWLRPSKVWQYFVLTEMENLMKVIKMYSEHAWKKSSHLYDEPPVGAPHNSKCDAGTCDTSV